MVAAYLAGWYGQPYTILLVAPFAAVFGGVAQFLAGMWGMGAWAALAENLSESFGHPVLSLGKFRKAAEQPPITVGGGEPGVIRGQGLNLTPANQPR